MSATVSSRPRGRGLNLAVAASLVLHVGAFAAWQFSGPAEGKKVDLDKAVVHTRLVKLGKKRDDQLLPRIDAQKAPPPAPPPKAPVNNTPKPTAAPKPKPKVVDRTSTMQNALSKLESDKRDPTNTLADRIANRLGTPSDEGDENGSKVGTAITGRMRADYFDHLHAKVQNHFAVPNVLDDAERIRLRAELHIRVGPNGQLLGARLAKPSGNSAFDNAVLSAAKSAAPFSGPPLPLRAEMRDEGVLLEMCPVSCR